MNSPRLSNHVISSLLVEKAIVWLSTLATLVWHWQYRKWDFPDTKLLKMMFGSPWMEKEAYRTSPIQLLSWYKFEGRSIVTVCPWFGWLNQSWILLGGKQKLYEVDGWKSCKRVIQCAIRERVDHICLASNIILYNPCLVTSFVQTNPYKCT